MYEFAFDGCFTSQLIEMCLITWQSISHFDISFPHLASIDEVVIILTGMCH